MLTNSTFEVVRVAHEIARRTGTYAVVWNIEVALMIGYLSQRCKNFRAAESAHVKHTMDHFKTRRVYRVGYEAEEGKWWVEMPLPDNDAVFKYEHFDAPHDMPRPIGDKVLILCTAPDAFVHESVGRRISADRFWVYVDTEQSESQGGSDEQA